MNKVVRKTLTGLGLYNFAIRLKSAVQHEAERYLQFYSEFINEGDLCFDIGANIGQRTHVFSLLGAKVVSLEPLPDCFRQLQKRFAGNENITLINKAVGANDGSCEMHVSDIHLMSSLSQDWISKVKESHRYDKSNWGKTINVEIVKLDDIIEKYGRPDFIKVDVEGYEYEVVKGLSKPVKLICLEFTPECIEVIRNSVRHLASLSDISVNFCFADRPTEFVLSKWARGENISDVINVLGLAKQVGDIFIKSKLLQK